MTVTITNDKVEAYLKALVRTGLFGHRAQDAARRLIERQIERMLDEEPRVFAGLNFEAEKKQSSKEKNG